MVLVSPLFVVSPQRRAGEAWLRTAPALWCALCALALALLASGCARRGKVRTRASIEALAEDPARDNWQLPAQLLAAAGVGPGSVVVDWGSGDGYLLPHLSAAVGPEGRVFAVEFEADVVEKLRGRVQASKLSNVSVHAVAEGELPGTGLFDRILMIDAYGELAEPVGSLERIRARLKAGGVLVVAGHKPDAALPGPPMQERIDAETVIAEARGAGFGEAKALDLLPRQWLLLLPNEVAAADDADAKAAGE